MKTSFYNLYIPIDKADYILYNTLSGAVFKVNKEGIEAIQKLREEKLEQCLIHELKRNHIWIDDDVDEKAVFKVLRERHKYRGTRAYFCVYMTYDCNLACNYCYVANVIGIKRPEYLKGETLNAVIKFIKNSAQENGIKELFIVFTGGEPTLNISGVLKTLEILDSWTKKKGLKFKSLMWSNGTLFTRDIVQELLKYNIFVQIALAGSSKIHNKKRGLYKNIIKTLRMFRESGLDFGIRVDVDKENFHSMEDMLDDLKERVGRGLYIKFFPILPGAKEDPWSSLCLEERELTSISRLWTMATRKGFKVVINPLRRYEYCPYLTDYSYNIDPIGNVYRCDLPGEEHKIGIISNNGKLLKQYQYYDWMCRDPLNMKKCESCKYLPACGGGCAGIAYYKYQTYHAGECHEKYLIKERIKFLLKRRCQQ